MNKEEESLEFQGGIDDEVLDTLIADISPISLNELLEEWNRRFGKTAEPEKESLFSSHLDWEVGNWAIRDSASKSAFDRFLAIPGVSTGRCSMIFLSCGLGGRTFGSIVQEYKGASSKN